MPGLCLFAVFLLLSGSGLPVEDDIKERVFRYQIEQVKAPMYYLAFGNSRKGLKRQSMIGPSREFMQRFAGESDVKRFTDERFVSPDEAVVLSIDEVERRGTRAEVAARYIFADVTKSSAGFYQLELKYGTWTVVGKKRVKIIPLQR